MRNGSALDVLVIDRLPVGAVLLYEESEPKPYSG